MRDKPLSLQEKERLERERQARVQADIERNFPKHKGDRFAGSNSWERHLHVKAMRRYKQNKAAKIARKNNRGK